MAVRPMELELRKPPELGRIGCTILVESSVSLDSGYAYEDRRGANTVGAYGNTPATRPPMTSKTKQANMCPRVLVPTNLRRHETDVQSVAKHQLVVAARFCHVAVRHHDDRVRLPNRG